MRKQISLYCFLVLAIFFSVSTQAQWTSGYVPYGRDANSVQVIDKYHAAIGGGREINDSIRSVFMTTDRGANWNINLDVVKAWIRSVYFTDTLKGMAVGV